MIDRYVKIWSKWFDYKGRTSPTDFWILTVITWSMFAIYKVSNGMVAALPVDKGDNVGVTLSSIAVVSLGWWALSLPPQISAAWRRINDVNLSPIFLLPAVGYFLIVHEHWSRWIALIFVVALLSLPEGSSETEA